MSKAKCETPLNVNALDFTSIELGRIPVERISDEEAAGLARLSEETDKEGISWKRLKADLGL